MRLSKVVRRINGSGEVVMDTLAQMNPRVRAADGDVGVMTYVTITPSDARALLEGSDGNRPISMIRVKRYADDMKRGRWRGGDSVMIVTGVGRVLDGQHRLRACVASGVAFATWLRTVEDGDPQSLRVDTGAPRNAAYLTGLPSELLAATRVLYWAATETEHGAYLSVDGLAEYARRVEPEFSRLTRTKRKGVTLAAVRAGVCFSMHRCPDEAQEIARQYEVVARGENERVWSGFHSAMSQIATAAESGYPDRREAFVRVVRGLDESSRNNMFIRVSDYRIPLREWGPELRAYLGIEDGK